MHGWGACLSFCQCAILRCSAAHCTPGQGARTDSVAVFVGVARSCVAAHMRVMSLSFGSAAEATVESEACTTTKRLTVRLSYYDMDHSSHVLCKDCHFEETEMEPCLQHVLDKPTSMRTDLGFCLVVQSHVSGLSKNVRIPMQIISELLSA